MFFFFFFSISANCCEKFGEWHVLRQWIPQVGQTASTVWGLPTTTNVFLFFSLGIIYGVFSFSNLLAPTVVAIIGAKMSMFFSGLLYRYLIFCLQWEVESHCLLLICVFLFVCLFSGYIAVFIVPATWSLYFTSVLIGVGAASKFLSFGFFSVSSWQHGHWFMQWSVISLNSFSASWLSYMSIISFMSVFHFLHVLLEGASTRVIRILSVAKEPASPSSVLLGLEVVFNHACRDYHDCLWWYIQTVYLNSP